MKNGSRYVFGAAMAGVALGLPGLIEQAHAGSATAALFTFEGLTVTATGSGTGSTTTAGTTGAAFGPYAADSGMGSAFGVHAAATTVYSSPAGNGSSRSLSSNVWAAGDYYSFSIPTANLNDLVFSFDQGSSSTGPKAFTFAYSVDGTNFSSLANYTVVASSTNSTGGTATTNFGAASNSGFNVRFDLSSLTALNNDASAAFRLVDADTTTATGGTDRVDNVLLTADSVGTPEPSALVLTAVGAGSLLARRRRSRS